MELDPVLIARLQFAFTIIWHIIFPAFTIGLSAYVATLCVMWMRTGKDHYRELARFWTKIFAAAFAMGGLDVSVLNVPPKVALFDLRAWNTVVALAIAVFKAAIVVLFFMHVKYSTRLTWAVVVGSIFWLGILLSLTLSDYLTRPWRTYG